LDEPHRAELFSRTPTASHVSPIRVCGRYTFRYSRITEIELTTEDGASRWLLKELLGCTADHARVQLEKECAALQFVSGSLDSSLLSTIPCPAVLDLDHGLLIMPKLPGTPLARLIQLRRLPDAHSVGRAVGHWLRSFQLATLSSSAPIDAAGLSAEMSALRELCVSRGLDATMLDRMKERAQADLQRAGSAQVAFAAAHRDFIPQNLLKDGSSLRVIDFGDLMQRAPVHLDAAFFVAYLRMLASHPLYSRRILAAVLQGFWETYDLVSGTDPGFEAFLCWSVLDVASGAQVLSGWRRMTYGRFGWNFRLAAFLKEWEGNRSS
jgi:aminoglycoside/choline kinase family phosphotransferase